jgi:hypothetical protein
MAKFVGSIKVKHGTYQKDGETKNNYVDIGALMEGDNGFFALFEPFINLAAFERGGKESVMASVFQQNQQGGQGQTSRIGAIKVKHGTYQKDGETKNNYIEVGSLMSGGNGGYFVLLNPYIQFSGFQIGEKGSVMASVFTPNNAQQGQPMQQQGGFAPQGQPMQQQGGFAPQGQPMQQQGGYAPQGQPMQQQGGYAPQGQPMQQQGGYAPQGQPMQQQPNSAMNTLQDEPF